MSRLWVRYPPYKPIKIPVDGCEMVDDLFHVLVRPPTHQLLGLPLRHGPLALALTAEGPELEHNEPIPAEGNSYACPLYVRRVERLADLRGAPGAGRVPYTDQRALELLDEIAVTLSTFYDFLHAKQRPLANVAEVLAAVEEGAWSVRITSYTIRLAEDTNHPVTLHAGDAYTKVSLPDVYTSEEWGVIRDTWRKLDRGRNAAEQGSGACIADLVPLAVECIGKLQELHDILPQYLLRGMESDEE